MKRIVMCAAYRQHKGAFWLFGKYRTTENVHGSADFALIFVRKPLRGMDLLRVLVFGAGSLGFDVERRQI